MSLDLVTLSGPPREGPMSLSLVTLLVTLDVTKLFHLAQPEQLVGSEFSLVDNGFERDRECSDELASA